MGAVGTHSMLVDMGRNWAGRTCVHTDPLLNQGGTEVENSRVHRVGLERMMHTEAVGWGAQSIPQSIVDRWLSVLCVAPVASCPGVDCERRRAVAAQRRAGPGGAVSLGMS